MIPRYMVNFDLQQLPTVYTDVIVIGAGIAGLFTALRSAETHKVLMVTKKNRCWTATHVTHREHRRGYFR